MVILSMLIYQSVGVGKVGNTQDEKMHVLAVIHVVSLSLARKMVIFRIISPRKNSHVEPVLATKFFV